MTWFTQEQIKQEQIKLAERIASAHDLETVRDALVTTPEALAVSILDNYCPAVWWEINEPDEPEYGWRRRTYSITTIVAGRIIRYQAVLSEERGEIIDRLKSAMRHRLGWALVDFLDGQPQEQGEVLSR